jgi:type IV pilus assembly protein PilC
MPEFTYTAKDRSGKIIEGVIYADNSALALGKVRELGYFPEKIRALDTSRRNVGMGKLFAENFIYPVVSGVPLKALAQFYRQFSTMIAAGIPLYQSLVTLESQTKNPKLAAILRDCQRQVQAGGKLSDVFAAYPWVFSELQIEMIRAAEHGGMLEKMLLRIADYLEQEIDLRRMISRLTLYPKIVIFIAWMLLGIRFFTDFTPAFSKLIIGMMKPEFNYTVTDYLIDTVFSMAIVLLIIFGIVAFCRIVLFQSGTAQESYEQLKMSIPGLGSVVKQFALAKFGRAFGAMYEAGMPMHTAIRVAGSASGSKIIAKATRRAIASLERGAVLSQAFHETGVFPRIVVDMLHTGEQTGNVDAMMSKVAEYLEGDAESKAHMYSHIFAATVGLFVALLIGYAVIRFYGNLGSSIGSQLNEAAGSLPGGE